MVDSKVLKLYLPLPNIIFLHLYIGFFKTVLLFNL